LQFLLGLFATLVLGFGVKPLIDCAKKSMVLPAPNATLEREWAALMKGNEGGRVLGYLERFFFFGAFWGEANGAAAAWLAFKVASKWNAWSNVISVPKEIEGLDPIQFLIARRCWGSHLLTTFLIGTLANILAGGLGVFVGKHGYALLSALCAALASQP
jgi:hypothetical protein